MPLIINFWLLLYQLLGFQKEPGCEIVSEWLQWQRTEIDARQPLTPYRIDWKRLQQFFTSCRMRDTFTEFCAHILRYYTLRSVTE